MTLWRRAPREVYRVYGEDEYLGEGETHVGEQPWLTAHEQSLPASLHEHLDSPSDSPPEIADREDVVRGNARRVDGIDRIAAISPTRASRSVTLVAFGLLGGVTVSVLALVVLNASHRSPAQRSEVAQSTRTLTAGDTSAPGRPSSNGVASHVPAARAGSAQVVGAAASGRHVHSPASASQRVGASLYGSVKRHASVKGPVRVSAPASVSGSVSVNGLVSVNRPASVLLHAKSLIREPCLCARWCSASSAEFASGPSTDGAPASIAARSEPPAVAPPFDAEFDFER